MGSLIQTTRFGNALRACRKALADEHNIAPYMVFHDATLMELMELRPGFGNRHAKYQWRGRG
ncbi:MAG: HRDC domain-containing protein [Porticoccaceae bacterium]